MDPSGEGLRRRLYLGDAVYIGQDSSGAFVLWTTDGVGVTNRIVLELEVVEHLFRYLQVAVPVAAARRRAD